ncbi:class I SAM-dependent methyltransferase [Patulibacter defluvii]|uniref:class I SAM-dependent methyltransferase n=1 Tax=Patulibacter defluvii TaxID=3095358 RepID=UPI002A76269F|nr:methyltransferase domain-containing protein [Patulibacter sp. DM4]
MAVDPLAERGFAHAADRYERGRPGYPPAAVERLIAALGLAADATVCDLAAGTGKLTRELTGRVGHVIAVEPSAGMRVPLAAGSPTATVLDGTAERIPLDDASVDAVFVAQAFHWFDVPVAGREIARVLRPGGGLAVLWNRAVGDGRLEDLLGEHLPSHRTFPGGDHERWSEALATLPAFGPIAHDGVDHVQRLDVEGAVAQVASYSWIAALPDDERARVLERTRAAMADRDTIDLRLRCGLYWTRRR